MSERLKQTCEMWNLHIFSKYIALYNERLDTKIYDPGPYLNAQTDPDQNPKSYHRQVGSLFSRYYGICIIVKFRFTVQVLADGHD